MKYIEMPEKSSLLDLYAAKQMSKKQIHEVVYLRISNGLADLDISCKKFEKALKRTSKQMAKLIIKSNRKEKLLNGSIYMNQEEEIISQLKKEA